MATLKSLLERKLDQIDYDETNLRKGQIYTYAQAGRSNFFPNSCTFCWVSPGTGQAIIDIWGAGGSSALMRCCGGGLPGNPGAWSRKCICVVAGCMICGNIGVSCSNSNTACFRGCSQPTEICWFGKDRHTGLAVDGCMCAEGGRGGTSYCHTSSGGIYCCFIAGNFCGTQYLGDGCGIICNFGPGTGTCCAESYGGDINKKGGFSCMTWFNCRGSCGCRHHGHVAIPPGFYGCEGAVVTHGFENNNGFAQWVGSGLHQFIASLNAMNPQPKRGIPFSTCYNGSKACSCYQMMGCTMHMPPAVGGVGVIPCTDFCHHGWRGGNGLVRINFIPR